jgi:hypothetical protein
MLVLGVLVCAALALDVAPRVASVLVLVVLGAAHPSPGFEHYAACSQAAWLALMQLEDAGASDPARAQVRPVVVLMLSATIGSYVLAPPWITRPGSAGLPALVAAVLPVCLVTPIHWVRRAGVMLQLSAHLGLAWSGRDVVGEALVATSALLFWDRATGHDVPSPVRLRFTAPAAFAAAYALTFIIALLGGALDAPSIGRWARAALIEWSLVPR